MAVDQHVRYCGDWTCGFSVEDKDYQTTVSFFLFPNNHIALLLQVKTKINLACLKRKREREESGYVILAKYIFWFPSEHIISKST